MRDENFIKDILNKCDKSSKLLYDIGLLDNVPLELQVRCMKITSDINRLSNYIKENKEEIKAPTILKQSAEDIMNTFLRSAT